jgi:hypothetical protein
MGATLWLMLGMLSLSAHAWQIRKEISFGAFNDTNFAERLARAFRHTVEACGGKPSAF